ncbi:MAG: DMT family transporter [Chloroflexota bacterium]
MSLGIVLALAATVGWGTGDVLARKAAMHAPAGAVVVAMTGIVALALAVVVAFTSGVSSLAVGGWWFYPLAALMGLLSYLGGQALYLLGMQRAGVTLTAPIIGAVPLLTVGLAVVFGGERPSLPTLAGAGIVVAGIALVVTDRGRALRP